MIKRLALKINVDLPASQLVINTGYVSYKQKKTSIADKESLQTFKILLNLNLSRKPKQDLKIHSVYQMTF